MTDISPQRIIKYDIIKGVAAFLICIYHLQSVDFGSFNNSVYIPNFNKFIYGLCSAGVPLFFIISGELLSNRVTTLIYNLQKCINALKVYIIWSLICGFSILLIGNTPITNQSFLSAINYLWYFQSLAFIYLFNVLWKRIKCNKYSILIPISILIYPFIINFIFDIITFIQPTNQPIHTGFFRMYSILYFVIPYYYTKKISTVISLFLILLGLILIYFEVYVYSNYYGYIYDGVNSSFPTIGALCVTFGLYSILSSKDYYGKSPIIRIVSFFGKNCLGIYIFHIPIIVLFKNFICNGTINPIYAVIVSILIMVISSCFYNYLKKLPLFGFLLKL